MGDRGWLSYRNRSSLSALLNTSPGLPSKERKYHGDGDLSRNRTIRSMMEDGGIDWCKRRGRGSTWSKGYLPITCQFSRYRVPIRSNPIDDDINHVGGPSMHFPLRKPYPKVYAYYTTLRVVTYYCLMARWREYYRIYNMMVSHKR